MNKRITVTLNSTQVDFINWLARRDGQSFAEEMQNLFYLQLGEEMDLYLEEMVSEEAEGFEYPKTADGVTHIKLY